MVFAGQDKCPEAGNRVGMDRGVIEVAPVYRGSDEKRVIVLVDATVRDVNASVVVSVVGGYVRVNGCLTNC